MKNLTDNVIELYRKVEDKPKLHNYLSEQYNIPPRKVTVWFKESIPKGLEKELIKIMQNVIFNQ